MFLSSHSPIFIAGPNLTDLLKATISVTANWKNLGLLLGLQSFELDVINSTNKGDVNDCQRDMITKWLNTGDASWRALVRALASPLVGKRGLAMSIAAEHPSVNP